jgi:hypothetical protein
MYSAFAVRDRGAKGKYVIFHGNPDCAWDRRMQAQSLAHDHIEVRKGVELVHCWVICVDSKEFVPKFGLHPQILRQREESPRCSGAKVGCT